MTSATKATNVMTQATPASRTTATMSRINRLTEKRAKLYSAASSGRKSGAAVREQINRISAELEQLWELRRRERVGRLDGIDLLIDQSYAQIYGTRFEDVVAPPTVNDTEQDVALVA